jgi:hypothetical protein
MKLKLSIAFLLITLCFTIVAQQNILEKDTIKQVEPKDYVPEVRLYLIERLAVSDREKVKELQNYLIEGEDKLTRNLYLQEKILLRYWLGQFKALPELIVNPDPLDLQISDTVIILPPEDDLFTTLLNKVSNQAAYIKTVIEQNDSLNQEEKDFLTLSLDYFLGESHVSQEQLNQQSKAFIKKYPNSEYRNLIIDSYYLKYEKSKFGIDLSLLGGYHVNSGNVATLFDNGFALGLGIGVVHKSWILQTAIHTGISRPKRDIYLNDTRWEYNHSSNIFQFESSIGHIINDQKRLSFIPFLGIGTTSISPVISTEADEEYYRGVAFKAKFTSYAGIGIRFKVPKEPIKSIFGPYSSGFTYVKLQYRYSKPKLDAGYTGLGGEMHLISVSFGAFARELKSVKDF